MDEIRKQVARAHRRLVIQQFLTVATWAFTFTLFIAVVGILVPRLWPINVNVQQWDRNWMIGGALAGLAASIGWTYFVRKPSLDAAIEIDRRFGLKERVSSFLSLRADERDSEFGRALMDDASRRVARLDIAEKFQIALQSRALFVLIPAITMFLVAWIMPNAYQQKATAANAASEQVKKQVQKSTEELRKRIEEQRKDAEQKGLKDAELLLKKMADGLDHLKDNEKLDRKNAMVKLNNLAEDLQKRRNELGSSQQVKEQLKQLKDLQKGPGDKMMNAMKDGDFNKALDQLNALRDKIEKGELSKDEKAQLSKQLEGLQKKLEQFANEQEQAKKELQRQIEQKKAEGDLNAANKLQQQLEQLSKLDPQIDKMNKLAEKLGDAAKAAKDGDTEAQVQALAKLAKEMKQMQSEMQELQSLDSALDQLAEAKEGMAELDSDMMSDSDGNGEGKGDKKNRNPGRGMGKGRGQGERPEEETDTGMFESKVAGKVRPGQSVVSGTVAGPNKAGPTREQLHEQIINEVSRQSDPLTEQRLPRTQRQHTNQYMKILREGK